MIGLVFCTIVAIVWATMLHEYYRPIDGVKTNKVKKDSGI